MNLDLKNCCRLCLATAGQLSLIENGLADKINTYLPINVSKNIPKVSNKILSTEKFQLTEDDCLPKNICAACTDTIKSFDDLYALARDSNEKLLRILEKNRRDDEEEAADLAEALMLSDGDNLRLNFAATQDDGSDKSLSIETDLAKDIDR
jgi:hypothetical protein